MSQRICLNMIVKNEAPVISRCLNSIKPFISSWVIVDTGSTDETKAIILDVLKDIPGELHDRPWINFGENRTQAIELARNRADSDYIIIIDADETLEASVPFPELTHDAYQIKTVLEGLEYYRTQVVRTILPWRWNGVLHEYLTCDVSFTQDQIQGIINHPRHDGARSRDPLKYKKDSELLESALEKDPNNTRDIFYLAQSCRDCGLLEKSLAAYERRVSLGGWEEEVYISLLQIAKLKESLCKPEYYIIDAYLNAYNYRPSRLESLVYLARYCRKVGKHYLAYMFAKQASLITPSKDVLFVDTAAQSWILNDELSLAAYFTRRFEEAYIVGSRLISSPILPQCERERVSQNISYFEDAVKRK